MVCDAPNGLKSQENALFYRSVWPGLLTCVFMPYIAYLHRPTVGIQSSPSDKIMIMYVLGYQ